MSESDDFKPKPYSFELVDIYNKPLIINKNIKAICPPFHILLDHTIAIIWMLFSVKDKDLISLGSGQISWALQFLEGIANDSRIQCCGVDIKKAIDCLHCAFINCISQEVSFKIHGGGKNESETAIEKIEANNKLLNGESTSDSDQERDSFKSILLNDMLKR